MFIKHLSAAVWLASVVLVLRGMASVCSRCPECRSRRILSTLKTAVGSYCLCLNCGHAWHDDAAPDPPVSVMPA